MVEVTRRPKRQLGQPEQKQRPTPQTPERKEKELPNEASTLKKQIASKATVDIHLKTGKTLTGVILWFDTYHVGIALENGQESMLPKHAILYYEFKRKG